MALSDLIFHPLSLTFSNLCIILILAIPILLLYTYVSTLISFHFTSRRLLSLTDNNVNSTPPSRPPIYPYVIPWLGSGMAFTTKIPGSFWRQLQYSFLASDLSALRLQLAGQKAVILKSPTGIQELLKSKDLHRLESDHDVMIKALGCPEAEVKKLIVPHEDKMTGIRDKNNKITNQDVLWAEYLLATSAVNKLTTMFMSSMREQLETRFDRQHFPEDCNPIQREDGTFELNIMALIRHIMFTSSTTALYGPTILRLNPNFASNYWACDAGIMIRLLGLPRFSNKEAYAALDRCASDVVGWIKHAYERIGGDKNIDVDGQEWDEVLGARIVRARHRMYRELNLSIEARARFDLGFLFG